MNAVAPNTAKAMADHWSGRADSFQQSPSHRTLRDAWMKVFSAALGNSGGSAVDLGCGTGACALAFAELGYDVTAVDGSDGMLAHARADAADRGLRICFIESDMDRLDLPQATFDVVSIRNVLWTLEQPWEAVRLARRLLKPGGRVLLSDGIWRVGDNGSETEFGHHLPNFKGVSEPEAGLWLGESGFSSTKSWQHLFEEHPYGVKYDAVDASDLIDFFVLTAIA